ncbi:Terminase family protein [Sulfidibacter corallicola]|uniref:Terminase family protein n=1 Tax=Sulfidibacter corallicola TaxID=2818388 RepID=A0A8A4U603_SULCO|nr:terminase family protein [Sulfidibacter corallicola]QTD54175.1 terminase family protein [Sulfidibacter corallicola]
MTQPKNQDRIMAETLRNPAKWGEAYLRNRDGSPREYWPHQVEDLECEAPTIVHLDGRAAGKTLSLSTDALHFAFTRRGGKGLLAAPHQGQLDTLIEEIEFQLESNPELMASIATTRAGKPKIVRKPYFRLEFSNGSILYFRPAGAHGESFRSLHVQRIWVDEAAWLSERAWKALRRCLVSGGQLRVYSTPNGLRNTTYYRLTMSPNVTLFRWPSWLNPNWTKEMEAELLEFYGGRDSSGWAHEVAGEHGRPTYGAFNAEHLNLAFKELLEYQKIIITGNELKDCETEEEAASRLEMFLNLTPKSGVFWLGGDLGYTNDPTELVVFREDPVGNHPVLKLVLRVHMERVAYPNIAQTIALLDHYFGFVGLGVDYGGNGMATVQELLTLDKYKPLDLEGRLEGFHFGGMTTLAVQGGREIRKRTKELMTSLISGALQRRQLIFPSDDSDIEDEFSTHTYSLRDGKIIYSKGNDHIVDAVRCAMLARERGNLEEVHEETVSIRPVYTDPVFV